MRVAHSRLDKLGRLDAEVQRIVHVGEDKLCAGGEEKSQLYETFVSTLRQVIDTV